MKRIRSVDLHLQQGQSLLRTPIETAVLKRLRSAIDKNNLVKIRRAVWCIGELGLTSAVPNLIQLIPIKDDLLNYCTAFALGRCGNSQVYSALNALMVQTQSDAVKRMTMEALFATASKDQHQQLIHNIVHQLPDSIQTALSSNDTHLLAAKAGKIVFKGGPHGMMMLEELYRVARAYPCARRFVFYALGKIPFKPNYFRALRHIYKAAEFRRDAQIIARLTLRFEIEPAHFHRFSGSSYAILPGTWKSLNIKDEVMRPNSRLAFSNRTRDYFRKRVWRILRRMGYRQDLSYVSLATQILLAVTDQHATATKRVVRSRWERGTDGRWHSVQEPAREYGPYAGFVVFNHILYGNSSRHHLSPSSLTWLTITEVDPTTDQIPKPEQPSREEAFPELWDRQPEALLELLIRSRCEPVHSFAARALIDNKSFCQNLVSAQIISLLTQPYTVTIALGLRLAEQKYDPNAPDLYLISALLAADLAQARQIGWQWIKAQSTLITQAAMLVTQMLISRHADVRAYGRELVECFPLTNDQIQSQIVRIVAYLMGFAQSEAIAAVVIEDITNLFLTVWADQSRKIDIAVISDLYHHQLTALKVMAAKLLLQHEAPPDQLAPEMIRGLIESHVPELRSFGVQLFSGLPDSFLFRQIELIYTFCVSQENQVRYAVHSLVQKLANKDPAFGRNLFDRLFSLLFRKSPSFEFQQDLVTLFIDALATQTLALDSPTIWRLLQARAAGARQLGAYLLTRSDPKVFSIRQWAVLGRHALLVVRQWCWQTFQDHIAEVTDAMKDGLGLLDSDWDDTRSFAIAYFRNNFKMANWTPTLMIAVCDSVRHDVQQFGRELITSFFDAAYGAEYLLKLSQHPSKNVQLFVANFLETYIRGNLDRIAKLTPYFISVLSQVNNGRVVKTRIFNFLRAIALESPETAALVAPICNRISATIAIGDRSTCIQILCDIKRRYPPVATRLVSVPVPMRSLEG